MPMPVDPATASDLAYILDHTVAVGTLPEELILLRIALRLYAAGRSASDAVAEAAGEVSDALTRNPRPRP